MPPSRGASPTGSQWNLGRQRRRWRRHSSHAAHGRTNSTHCQQASGAPAVQIAISKTISYKYPAPMKAARQLALPLGSTARRSRARARHCKKHAPSSAQRMLLAELDPCSSARWFTGWKHPPAPDPRRSHDVAPVVPPRTWLLCTGWKRHGLIAVHETPSLPTSMQCSLVSGETNRSGLLIAAWQRRAQPCPCALATVASQR